MTAIITTGSIASALYPGLNKIFGMAYAQHPLEFLKLFDKQTTDRNYIVDQVYYGTGLAQYKTESAPIAYDQMGQSWSKRYVPSVYALGWIISREAMDDNLYPQLTQDMATQLGRTAVQTQETLAANVLNLGFSAAVGGDGQPLFSTAHPLAKGGTGANKMAVDADISEVAIQQLMILAGGMVDEAGNKMAVKPVSLHVPYKLEYEAKRIFGSTLQPSSANNDINTVYNLLPWYMNHYFTDDDAYFLKTDAPNGLKYLERNAPELTNDTPEFDTENMRYKMRFRADWGWSDWRGAIGSAGA